MTRRLRNLTVTLALISGVGIGAASAQNSPPGGINPANSSDTSVNAAANAKPADDAVKSNPSGSGTSTSGGKDDNGDGGRDKMPDSSTSVMPLSKQNEIKKR
jgi:hypothetical protein